MPKKPDLDTQIGKYFIAKQNSKTKKEAALKAGYADGNHVARIEQTAQYIALEKHYRDILTDKISVEEIAEYHADNIRQDKDRGARNKAIEMAVARIEPETYKRDEGEKVVFILKG